MRSRLFFLVALFALALGWMAVQKPLFLGWYAPLGGEVTPADWWEVVRHGLSLDLTVAGYITALPLLVTLASLWMPVTWERSMRAVLRGYLVVVAILTAVVVALDLGLYGYWGFRLDSSVLLYLADPAGAAASVTPREWLIYPLVALLYGGAMAVSCWFVVDLFAVTSLRMRARIGRSLGYLLLGGLLFVVIRGGVSVATANVSKVYFSSNQLLNHAATNPLFSLLSTLGDDENWADAYPFYPETVRTAQFEALRGNGDFTAVNPESEPESPQNPPSISSGLSCESPSGSSGWSAGASETAPQLLTNPRPNIVLILLESFGRTITDERIDGRPVTPNLLRLKEEGVWFENLYANSFRTDRGEVALLNGYPAQTRLSIMKLPRKSATLPSIARSLGRVGYRSLFLYGGDLNFTDQASYMYATGWERLLWQKHLSLDAPTSKWGYPDHATMPRFADEVEALSTAGESFLAALLTLSSHEPFEVPFDAFEDKVLNAMAYTDHHLGLLIDRLRQSSAWENLLVILVADHAYAYPYGIAYNTPERHRIPMLWLGGAVREPLTVETYASQMDLCATLLAQMGLAHDDYDFSKNLFDRRAPHFGYYTFNDGFGVVDSLGASVWDCTAARAVTGSGTPGDSIRIATGKTLLQSTYVDIDRR